jgi:hypothetical protein
LNPSTNNTIRFIERKIMQRRQFLQSALVGAGALLPGAGVAASPLSADSTPINGIVLPSLSASDLHDLLLHFIDKELLDAIKSLLGQGVDVNAKDDGGGTLLHYAAMWSNNVDILKCLVSAGADVNAKDEDGMTPLHTAVHYGSVDALKYLVSVGADANAKDKFGKMPLHVVYEENIECEKEKKRILGEAMKNPEDHFFALRTIDWDAEWKILMQNGIEIFPE